MGTEKNFLESLGDYEWGELLTTKKLQWAGAIGLGIKGFKDSGFMGMIGGAAMGAIGVNLLAYVAKKLMPSKKEASTDTQQTQNTQANTTPEAPKVKDQNVEQNKDKKVNGNAAGTDSPAPIAANLGNKAKEVVTEVEVVGTGTETKEVIEQPQVIENKKETDLNNGVPA